MSTSHSPLADHCNNNRWYICCRPPCISMCLMEICKKMYCVSLLHGMGRKSHICDRNGAHSIRPHSIKHKTRHKCHNSKSLRRKRHQFSLIWRVSQEKVWQYFIQHLLMNAFTVVPPSWRNDILHNHKNKHIQKENKTNSNVTSKIN